MKIYFSHYGEVSAPVQACLDSWRKLHGADVEQCNEAPGLPAEFQQLKADYEAADTPRRQHECAAKMANLNRWAILAAPKKWDGATQRVVIDSDVWALQSADTLFKTLSERDKTGFVGTLSETANDVTLAVCGGVSGHPFFKACLRFAPAFMLAKDRHIDSLHITGTPYLRYMVMDRMPDGLEDLHIFESSRFYAYGPEQRTRRELPDAATLTGAQSIHGWFRSYGAEDDHAARFVARMQELTS